MEPERNMAEEALLKAAESNPGAWVDHSRYVAEACRNIALSCKDLSADRAYILGLLDCFTISGVMPE